MNGDALLSAHDMSLWRLIQHVLLTWNTLVVVKSEHYNVPQQRNGYVTFFVPRDATFCGEIVAFLEREGKQFASDGFEARPERGIPRIPPVHVRVEITTFSGLLPYVEQEKADAMVREFTTVAMQRLKGDFVKWRRSDLEKAGPDPWWGVFPIPGFDPIATFKDETDAIAWLESRVGNNTKWLVKPVARPIEAIMTTSRAAAVELRQVVGSDVVVEADDVLSVDVEVWLADDYERWANARLGNRSCDKAPIKTYPAVEAQLSAGRVGKFQVEDLADSVVGLKIGESGEAETDLPGDYEIEKGRNEPAVLRMKVMAVKRPVKT